MMVDGIWLRRNTNGVPVRQLSVSFLICLMLMGSMACENKPPDASVGRPDSPAAQSGFVRLTPEESSRIVLTVAPVTRGAALVPREFPATVQFNENEVAEVTTLIRGRVVKVYVDVGQDVKKDTLLAMLHSSDLGEAEGAYLKAVARLHEAEMAHNRAKELYENKAVSLAELQRREAAMKTAQAEARAAQNRLELLGVPSQEIMRLDRDQTIKADVPLRAPFDGRVITRNITRGEVVEPDQKLFTVAELSHMWVVGKVPEKDVQHIRKDQKVEVVLAAYPHAIFSGAITYIGDVLDPATRTMRLRVTVANPDRLLKPEMFAAVRVHSAPTPDVLTLPLEAIQDGLAGKIVFVRRGASEFEVRKVTLGSEQGDRAVLLDGVSEGEPVVTKGAFVLKSEMERHKIEPTP